MFAFFIDFMIQGIFIYRRRSGMFAHSPPNPPEGGLRNSVLIHELIGCNEF